MKMDKESSKKLGVTVMKMPNTTKSDKEQATESKPSKKRKQISDDEFESNSENSSFRRDE